MSRVLWWLLYAAAAVFGGWAAWRVLGGRAFDRGFRKGLDARPVFSSKSGAGKSARVVPFPEAPRCLARHPELGGRCVYAWGDHPTMSGHAWHFDGDGMGWPAW